MRIERLLVAMHTRLGWRAWYVVAMWVEKARELCGLPPGRYEFVIMVLGKPVLKFAVAWSRRRYRLDLVEACEEVTTCSTS